MKFKMYSVKDTKIDAFNRPMFFQNEKHMYASIERTLKDPDSDLARHAADYQLFYLGEFDDVTGVIDGVPPQFLFNAAELAE